jgi:hypothetical protein
MDKFKAMLFRNLKIAHGHVVRTAAATIDYSKIALPRRTVVLLFSLGLFAFIVFEQANSWELFRPENIVRPDASLPIFSPKKEAMSDSLLRCSEENGSREIVGEYSMDQFIALENIKDLVKDQPMEAMASEVAKRDMNTAAYLVAIAKKESNLGKLSPKDADGKDCFNYWGFRGSQNTTKSGYSCFDSPEQAVAVVGDRIQYLTQLQKLDTPRKMVVWKCGASCAGHGAYNVNKWVSDVDYYFDKINNL